MKLKSLCTYVPAHHNSFAGLPFIFQQDAGTHNKKWSELTQAPEPYTEEYILHAREEWRRLGHYAIEQD